MWTIVKRIYRDKRKAIFGYSFASALITLLYASLLPTFVDQADELEKLYETFPDGFFKAFGIEQVRFDTLEKFLSVEFYSLIWPILVIIFAIGLAGFLLAAEVEKGTIEHLLSKPQSRIKVFFSKYFGGASILLTFTIITVLVAIPTAAMFDVPYEVESTWWILALCSLFVLATFSIGMFVSAIVSEKGKVGVYVGVLYLAMYLANVVSLLMEDLEWLKHFSFFHYFDYQAALVDHAIGAESIAVFGATAIVGLTMGAVLFHRRDIAT